MIGHNYDNIVCTTHLECLGIRALLEQLCRMSISFLHYLWEDRQCLVAPVELFAPPLDWQLLWCWWEHRRLIVKMQRQKVFQSSWLLMFLIFTHKIFLDQLTYWSCSKLIYELQFLFSSYSYYNRINYACTGLSIMIHMTVSKDTHVCKLSEEPPMVTTKTCSRCRSHTACTLFLEINSTHLSVCIYSIIKLTMHHVIFIEKLIDGGSSS